MLSFNRIRIPAKGFVCATLAVLSLGLAACSVQPLYKGSSGDGQASINVAPDMRTKLASVYVEGPSDRTSQIVRNRLIFLLNGGAGQPANPTYKLSLNINMAVLAAVRVDIGDRTDRTGRASAGSVQAIGNYELKDMDDKKLLHRRRTVTASFDRPRQEYANLQAEEDAKERAGEELAQQIYLSLAQELSKR